MPKNKVGRSKKSSTGRASTLFTRFFQKIKFFYKKRMILKIIITALLVWGLIWICQVGVERYKFYEAEKKLDKLAAQLQQDIGNKYELTKVRYCEYGSAKFSRGNRVCNIQYVLKNTQMSLEDANVLAGVFKNSVNDSKDFRAKIFNGDPIPFIPKSTSSASVSQGISFLFGEEKTYPRCSANLTYNMAPEALRRESSTISDYAYISLSCYGNTKKEFFPVED